MHSDSLILIGWSNIDKLHIPHLEGQGQIQMWKRVIHRDNANNNNSCVDIARQRYWAEIGNGKRKDSFKIGFYFVFTIIKPRNMMFSCTLIIKKFGLLLKNDSSRPLNFKMALWKVELLCHHYGLSNHKTLKQVIRKFSFSEVKNSKMH